MQISPTAAPRSATATATTTTTAPGAVLGTGIVKVITTGGIQFEVARRMNITAGATIQTGIRDVRAAAQELIRRTWEHDLSVSHGLVGFVRNGDTFDAVELLAPTFTDGSSTHGVWAPWTIAAFKPADDLVAVWQITPYGGDTRLGQPDTMFPPTLPVAPH